MDGDAAVFTAMSAAAVGGADSEEGGGKQQGSCGGGKRKRARKGKGTGGALRAVGIDRSHDRSPRSRFG